MKRFTILSIILVPLTAILLACATEPVEVVVVVTATPDPITATPIPATATPIPSATPEPTVTNTPEPTPTPDIRVINASPRSMLTKRTDLPADGKFYLYDESPHRNSEILSGWGVERGRNYLAASGRVDGWGITYVRGTRTAKAPEWVKYNVILYLTASGHAAGKQELGQCNGENGWNEIPAPEGIIYLCEWRKTQSNGKDYLKYEAKVEYRNVGVQIWVGGYEDEFDVEWLFDRVIFQLELLKSTPLSETVTYAP